MKSMVKSENLLILAFFVCLPPYICREDDAGRVSTVFIRFLRPPGPEGHIYRNNWNLIPTEK